MNWGKFQKPLKFLIINHLLRRSNMFVTLQITKRNQLLQSGMLFYNIKNKLIVCT